VQSERNEQSNPALLDGHERKLEGPGNDKGEDKVGNERMFLDPSGYGRTSNLRTDRLI
jgi:hypothetical protein